MEIKRRKLEPSTSTTIQTTNYNVLNSKQLIDSMASGDLEKVIVELSRLKKFLTSKERVLTLMQNNKQCFDALISLVLTNANRIHQIPENAPGESPQSQEHFTTVLREAISLLANCCHLSVLACVEIRARDTSLRRLYVHLLEASHLLVPFSVKATILRLLGNLCELKETATVIVYNPPLLDRIALLLDLDDQQIADQALRIIRLLSKRRPFSKSVMSSNSCYHIAKYIARNKNQQIFENRPDILQTLNFLLKYHPQSMGRQLSNCSEFMDMCLEHLLTFPTHEPEKATTLAKYWLEFVLHAVHYSADMRTVFGQANAINKILEREQNYDQLSDIHCRFLCSFTRHAYYRTSMLENGSLIRILDRLEPLELDAELTSKNQRLDHFRLQLNIMEHLRQFLYENSLGDAIRHPNFMRITLHNVNRFLNENTPKCRVLFEPDGNHIEQPFPDLAEVEVAQIASTNPDEQLQPLCKNFSNPSFYNANSPSVSPSFSSHGELAMTSSPSSMSPSTSTGHLSPSQFVMSPSASPPQFPDANNSSQPGCSPTSFFLDDFLSTPDQFRKGTISPTTDEAAAPGELEPDDPTAIAGFDDQRNQLKMEESQSASNDNDNEEAELRRKGKRVSLVGSNRSTNNINIQTQIVYCSLMLISHHSHAEESQSIFLLKKEIMDMMLRYISDAPELDNRLVRSLRRLARHQTGLQLLLEMDFQQMVLARLIRRECLLVRFARPCARCDIRRDIGRMILSDNAMIADSQMGWHILLKLRMDAAWRQLEAREADFLRIRTMLAALVLFRREQQRSRFYHSFRPVDSILDAIGNFMRESVENRKPLDESSREGNICCDIVATLASILPQQIDSNLTKAVPVHFSRYQKMENEKQDNEENNCVLERKSRRKCWDLDQGENCSQEQTLKFHNNSGRLLAEVPKKELCEWNEYFSGMFGSEFVERLQNRDQFVFNADVESSSFEMVKKNFPTKHISIGCALQSECVRMDSAECCAALLYLADKYLCTRLLDHLLAGGIAARLVNGRSLKLFLPLVLSVPTVENGLKQICMLVLLRYSNNSELLSTLRHVVECDPGSGRTIDTLIAMIREFMANYVPEALLENRPATTRSD